MEMRYNLSAWGMRTLAIGPSDTDVAGFEFVYGVT